MNNAHIAKLGSGALFVNDKKTGAKSPDYKGTIMLSHDYKAGQTLRIAGWVKPTPKGNLIALAEDNWKPNAATGPREQNNDDNDVPF